VDLGEVGWGGVDWIGLAQDRNRWRALVNAVMNLWVPLNAGKLSSGFTTGGLSSSAQLHRISQLNMYQGTPEKCAERCVGPHMRSLGEIRLIH
jgi:hypothetical protein